MPSFGVLGYRIVCEDNIFLARFTPKQIQVLIEINKRLQIQSNPIQSNPIQSKPNQTKPNQTKPNQSNPIQSNPIQSNPYL